MEYREVGGRWVESLTVVSGDHHRHAGQERFRSALRHDVSGGSRPSIRRQKDKVAVRECRNPDKGNFRAGHRDFQFQHVDLLGKIPRGVEDGREIGRKAHIVLKNAGEGQVSRDDGFEKRAVAQKTANLARSAPGSSFPEARRCDSLELFHAQQLAGNAGKALKRKAERIELFFHRGEAVGRAVEVKQENRHTRKLREHASSVVLSKSSFTQ